MKKLFLTLVLLVGIAVGLFAQKLTYQAVIRDNNQQLVVNTPMKATVTIDFSTGNDPTWTVDTTTNLHGLLSIEFGDATLNGRDWTNATIAVKVVNKNDESTVYVNDDARPVSAVPYALSVNGQSIKNYLTEHNYVDQTELTSRHYLTSDSAVITTMQDDIAALQNASMDCNDVKNCIKDTLIQYTPTTDLCNELSNCQFLADLLQGLTNQISDLKEQVDSLSNLPHGGGDTPTAFTCGTDKVKDVDLNEYNTVAIGNQCWMAQNLRTKLGTDGDKGYPTGAGNDTVTYGRLYTWNAMMKGAPSTNYPAGTTEADTIVHGICPTGWHVPSDAEWDTLTRYVFSKDEYKCGDDCGTWQAQSAVSCIANALSSTTGWSSNTSDDCNAGNTGDKANATGFSAVPAGGCFSGGFDKFGNSAYFLSATQSGANTALCRLLSSNDSSVYSSRVGKVLGFSVRCLRDAGVGGTPGENETGGTTPSAPATVSCDKVMECMGDTLGRLNAKIEDLNTTVTAQGQTITTQGQTITAQGQTIDSLARIVDSLSNLTPGGGDTPTEVADGQPCPGAETVSDGTNTYNTVKIGSQCWTKENLRTTKYADGTSIDNSKMFNPDGSEDNVATYGKLYTWSAATRDSSTTYPAAGQVKVQGICPTGWHVPSDAEWDTLTYYVFNSTSPDYKCGSSCGSWAAHSNVSCIAKALASTTGWNSYTGTSTNKECFPGYTPSANNATGFSAVPAGIRSGAYGSRVFGSGASFWSATENDDNNKACYRGLLSGDFRVGSGPTSKADGYSVRCLRDN